MLLQAVWFTCERRLISPRYGLLQGLFYRRNKRAQGKVYFGAKRHGSCPQASYPQVWDVDNFYPQGGLWIEIIEIQMAAYPPWAYPPMAGSPAP